MPEMLFGLVTIGNFRLVLGLNIADSNLWPIPWKTAVDTAQPKLLY